MRVDLDLQGWNELDRQFRAAPQIVSEELLSAVTEADTLLQHEVQDLTPTATGLSRASITTRETVIPGGALGEVGTAQPHMVYVELGTRPHHVPIEPLEDWVRVKFGLTDEKRITGMACAIERKIAQRGTLGVGMFHRTWARQQTAVVRLFEAARNRIAARLAGSAA